MTNKQQEATADLLYFDGSAEPNPGGRMGAGCRLVFPDRPEETQHRCVLQPTQPPVIGRLRQAQAVSSILPVNPREHLWQVPRAHLEYTT